MAHTEFNNRRPLFPTLCPPPPHTHPFPFNAFFRQHCLLLPLPATDSESPSSSPAHCVKDEASSSSSSVSSLSSLPLPPPRECGRSVGASVGGVVCTPKGWNDGGGREGRTEGEALVVHARDEEGIHGQAAGGGRDMVPFLSSLARPLRRKVHEKNSTHAARPFPKEASDRPREPPMQEGKKPWKGREGSTPDKGRRRFRLFQSY